MYSNLLIKVGFGEELKLQTRGLQTSVKDTTPQTPPIPPVSAARKTLEQEKRVILDFQFSGILPLERDKERLAFGSCYRLTRPPQFALG